jgi:acetoin utilization deacetylase AcuC-like enzyme
MVIFNEKQKDNLKDFGILIPISDSKSRKSMEFLLNNPFFLKHKDKWLITEINGTITKEDLLRVHSQEYVERLFSRELKEEIIKTYELIDDEGRYHRYDPSIATLDFSFLLENILKKVAGTFMCLKTALQNNTAQIPGFCFYFGGGMHHAKYNYGEGFCLVNDLVISKDGMDHRCRCA